MAVVSPTWKDISKNGDASVYLIQWLLTSTDATGAGVELTEWGDRSVQAEGTWGGATCAMQVSNNATGGLDADGAWVACTDTTATAITWTASTAIVQVMPVTRWIRPKLTTAGSGASITVSMVVKRPQPMRT